MIDKNKNPFEMSAEEKRRQMDDMWNSYERSQDDSFEFDEEIEELEIFNEDEY